MSVLPKGWVTSTIGEACLIENGLRKPISLKERANCQGSFPYYGATGVIDYLNNYTHEGEYVLIGEDGANLLSKSKPLAFIADGKYWVNNHAHTLRCIAGSPNQYLEKFFNSLSLESWVTGSAQPKLTKKNLESIPYPLAPLAEQKRIVEKLDEVLAQVDTIKARLDGIPDLLKRFRQSVLASAVSGKLTEEWRGIKSFGEYVELGELLKDGPQNGLYKPSRFYGNGTKIFRIDSFYDGELVNWEAIKRVELEEQEIAKYSVGIDDVLVNRVNSIEYLGKCALVRELPENAVFESNIMRMSIDTEKALPAFVTIFLRSISGLKELRKNAKLAVNQASINQTDVKGCVLPLPKIEEQKEIVRLVDQYFAFADTIEAQVKKAQARVDNLTQSILAKAFRGELVPQDPNDEPADKLLERIAEARKEAEALAKAAKKAENAKKRAAKKAAENN